MLAIGLLISAVATSALVMLLLWRLVGRWGIAISGLALPAVVVLQQLYVCRSPGSCDGPGDAFMLLFWGPLSLVWLFVAAIAFRVAAPRSLPRPGARQR